MQNSCTQRRGKIMETLGRLKVLIFLLALKYVQSCSKKKDPHICPNIDTLSHCAILYGDIDCRGEAIEVNGDLNQTVFINSGVVKRDCFLSLYGDDGDNGQHIVTVTGVNDKIVTRTFTWAKPKEIIGGEGDKIITGTRNKREVIPSSLLRHYEREWEKMDKMPEYYTLDISFLTCSCNDHYGCPRNLEPRTKNGNSMCAVVYQHSTDDPNTSCFGHSIEVYNGEQVKKIESLIWNDEISAVVVREGCTFTGYENAHYRGSRKSFTGVNAQLANMNNKISSYMCKCVFPPLECTPFEVWKKVKVCSNPNSTEMSCSRWVSYGFSTGSTSTTEHGVSENIELSFGVELKKIYKLGVTSNTGYNWKTSTAFSKTDSGETKHIVEFKVPAGEKFALYQLVGQCGQIDVKTMYFEVRNEKTAEVVEHKEIS